MTWLAGLSLRNRALVCLGSVLVALAGVLSVTSLKQELIPSLEIPVATVISQLPGASPAVVEQQVTVPLEAAIRSVDGVTGVRSTSSGGVSAINAELDYGTDLADVQRNLQQAVSSVPGLPEGVDPTVVAGSLDEFPVIQLAVTSGMSDAALAETLREQVVPLVEDIDDVREVALSGVGERTVRIDLDPAALADREVTPAAVTQALRDGGMRVPAGTVGSGERELSVQVGAPITSLDEIRDLYLPSAPGGGIPVRLGEVARVSSEFDTATGYLRTDGEPSIGIGIIKTADASTVSVSHAVQDLVPRIEELLGADSAVTVVFDQAPFIEQSIDDLTTKGLLGLAFAVIVVMLFLLSPRATLVTAVSIPLSLLVAFVVLNVNGYSLNILTLGALTVAVGRVVDDSIVVIENIKRHLGYGEPTGQAVLGGVREVAGAITASTITTVAVFLPIALVGGQVGELFRPFAVTVSVALLASLLVSLTIVPVLASWFLKPSATTPTGERGQPAAGEPESVLQRGYVPVLKAALARPVLTCGAAVLVLAGTVALVPQLKTDFIGDSGQNTFQISQVLPPGTMLAATDAAARKVERVLADADEVLSYQAVVGSQGDSSPAALGGGGAATNTASFFVTTDPEADQLRLRDELRQRFDALSDAGTVTLLSGGGPGNGELSVVVQAEDEHVLAQVAGEVEQAMSQVPGAVDVTNNLATRQPTVEVRIDRLAATVTGLTEQEIGQTVATALRGVPLGSVTLDGIDHQVLVRTGAEPADVEALRALPLRRMPMGAIRLDDVATVTQVAQPASITRSDGSRSASITATPSADDLGAVTQELRQRLDELTLPPGVNAEIGGVSADQSEAFEQLGLALVLAVAIVYLVMVATFRSLVQPLLLLVSVPFAATGALGLLLVTGIPLGVPALIGMLMLIGIVVTNAIVLIDLVNQYRDAGAGVHDALIDGARRRLRPILMTALATICALSPLALGFGGGLFISQPLAVVVIGGLVSSTLLTLILVPVLYVLVERVRERLTKKLPAAPAPAAEPEPAPMAEPASATVTAGAVAAGAGTPGSSMLATSKVSPARTVSPGPATEQPSARDQPSGPFAVTGVVTIGEAAADAVPLPHAVLTLVSAEGEQINQSVTAEDGSYAMSAPTGGRYLVVCRPTAGNRSAQADWVSITGAADQHDIVLPTDSTQS